MATMTNYGPWLELRTIREKDGHSLNSLARAVPMSLGHLCDLENGRRQPTPQVVKRLALALNVPVSVLHRPADQGVAA